ncbi:hypothetical protein PINS_up004946 [Pythium insidiosum]|nr:hypothetical protein PINS_up004946 [Pythium insidiosum]
MGPSRLPSDVDPLDAFMATLSADATGTTETTADARRSHAVGGGERWRGTRSLGAHVAMDDHSSNSDMVTARNRRYKRLQQLLAERQSSHRSTSGDADDDWYFSDASMQQRSPALFHFHLGQYLNAATRDARHQVPSETGMTSLSAFLMQADQRREMDARRIAEQATWTGFRGLDEAMDDEDVVEEEEEEKEDESDEETKRDTRGDNEMDEELTLEERTRAAH